jgi:aspartyl-tRNA(Asn)/glutamyl-tRNA(Gln) amidotransferase subunit B
MKYEFVSGLETHIELSTKTKIFCGCTTAFGSEPNTNCCPICIGLPGTLPKLNAAVVDYAIRAGLATHCTINPIAKMDRKNYVYPDLAKAYQISQFDKPLCSNGYVELDNGRRIRILRIHIEEDAGKLVHRRGDTLVDYNRGGVPLIEIVSEPDIRSVEEAVEYVEKLQLIMKYIGVSDCKMQEGSLRCDVNLSIRPFGQKEFGTRTEIKNMNSFSFMAKALQYEYERQAELLDAGETVTQETLRWNTETGETESMRGKEDAQDYRYFREPDLVTIETPAEKVEALRQTLPELPDQKKKRYVDVLGLPVDDADMLVKHRLVAEFFDEAIEGIKNPKAVSNLILGEIFRQLSTDEQKELFDIRVTAKQMNDLAKLMDGGKLRANLARQTLVKMLETGKDVSDFLSEQDLAGVDDSALEAICKQVVEQNPKAVADYLSGKEKAFQVFIGGVMKATRGKADAGKARELILSMIQ